VKLAIVIVHYNSSPDLDRCLESLTAHAPAAEHEVVIVDNASRDEGLAQVRDRYPDFLWIFNSENTGYSRGCNLGMSQVDAQYYLILNPDIVAQPGALDQLLEFADAHPRAGMVGPQLLNEDGSIQESCRRFYTLKTLLLRRTFLGRMFPNSDTVQRHLMRDFDHRSTRPVDWVLGGCLLVRREAMDRTGPMDERFFLYFEDVDWCYRMWQAGFEVIYTPDARFMHRHRRESAQGTFSRSFWLHLGSLISFYEKWGILVWLLKKWRGPLLVVMLWLLDMVGLVAAFGAAYGLRGLMGGLFAEPLYSFSEYRPLLLFSVLLSTAIFLLSGRYRAIHRRRGRAPIEHLQQMGIVAVMLLAATYLGHLEVISRAVLLLFIPLLAAVTGAGERLFRRLLRRLERGYLSLERTLLVGNPRRIQSWLSGARNLTSQGVDVAGYLADPDSTDGGLPPLADGEIPWLGPRDEVLEVVRRYRISQVVFWESPGEDPHSWRLMAGLRRLRVRLRWQVADVWLLATGARAELFGSELSAVQSVDGGSVFRVIGGRLLALATGALIGVGALIPWLWFRVGRVSRGMGRQCRIRIQDVWGHEEELSVAVDGSGRVLSLGWQWPLAGSLLRGRLAVLGSRPVSDPGAAVPDDPGEILAFWQHDPRLPGLTGAWAVASGSGSRSAGRPIPQRAALAQILKQLWYGPCGLDELGLVESSTAGDETISRSDGEGS